MASIGNVSIEIGADASGFERDLRRQVVDAFYVVQRAARSAARSAERAFDEATDAMRRDITQLAQYIESLDPELDVHVDADAGREAAEELRESFRRSRWRIQREMEELADDIEDMDPELDVTANPSTKWASARFRWLSRPRVVEFFARLNKASVAAVSGQLAALAGARLAADYLRDVNRALKDMDRNLPAIMRMSQGITILTAAAFAAVGGLVTLAHDIALVAGAAFALPGIFGGMAAGALVVGMAAADLSDELGHLEYMFTDLQDVVSKNFWDVARDPIEEMVRTVLPGFQTELAKTGTVVGAFFSDAAAAVQEFVTAEALAPMFDNLRDSIDIATGALRPMVETIMTLGQIGSEYLPRLAQWFVDLTESFNDFIQASYDSGEIFEWIETGIENLHLLWDVLVATIEIFNGLNRAAEAAGGQGLAGFTENMQKVSDVVNSAKFQDGLTTLFEGAGDAMGYLTSSLGPLGDAIYVLRDEIADAMRMAGQTIATLIEDIARASNHPVFAQGLTDFFSGIQTGMETVGNSFPHFAAAMGAVGTFAGKLAEVLGAVLGAAIEAIGPMIQALTPALSAIAEVLGGWLITAIEAIAPPIQAVIEAIAEWITQNPALASALGLAVVAIGLVAAAIGGILGTIVPVISSLLSMVGAWAGASGAITAFISAAAPVIVAIGKIIAVVVAVGAALVYMWQTSETFRNGLMALGEAIMGFFAPVVAFIVGTVVPVLIQVGTAIWEAIQTVLDALAPLLGVIMEIVAAFIETFTPVIEFIVAVLAPVFTWLGEVISTAFTFIATVISTVINVITSILQVFLAVIQGDWSGAWEAIKNVASTVWDGIWAIVSAGIEFLSSIISFGLEFIQGIWSSIWSAISSVASSIWEAIKSAISSAIDFVASIISSVLSGISSTWNSVWSAISSFASSIWSTISSAIQSAITTVSSIISSVLSSISSIWSSIWSAISSVASSIWSTIRSVIQSAISSVSSTISSVLSSIQSAWTSAWSAITNFLSSAWSNIVSAVSNGISNVMSFFSALPGRITGALAGLPGQMMSVGTNIIKGLINGIKNMASAAINAAKGVVDGAIKGAKNLLGISSPSKVFDTIGRDLGQGFVNGIDKMGGSVRKAAQGMAGQANVGMDALATPTIGMTADARRAPKLPTRLGAYGPSDSHAGASGGAGMIVQGPLITVEHMSVDSDHRVKQVAQDLHTRAMRQRRAQGRIDAGGAVQR